MIDRGHSTNRLLRSRPIAHQAKTAIALSLALSTSGCDADLPADDDTNDGPDVEASWLDPGTCDAVDMSVVEATLGAPPIVGFAGVEDTDFGRRVRCYWPNEAGTASIHLRAWAGDAYWEEMVLGDEIGNYPEDFPAWPHGEARTAAPGPAFIYRRSDGAVEVEALGRASAVGDTELVELGSAFDVALGP